MGFFRLLNNPALNVKLNLEVRIFNPNPWLNNRTQEGSFLQNVQPYGSKSQFENGANAPEFEHSDKMPKIESENEKAKTKNEQKGRQKVKDKKLILTIQKFSNQIKFIDYIPTREIITYRHSFAY